MKNILISGLVILATLFSAHTIFAQHEELLHIAQGSFLEKQGQYEQAIIEYEKALKISPSFVEIYITIGNIYNFKLNDKANAIEIYKRGLKQVPDDFSLNLNIMYVYFDLDDLDNGIKQYKKLSEIRQDDHRFTFPRRIVDKLTSGMNSEERIVFYKTYLSINPSDTILHEYLSGVYMDKKEYQKAKNEFNALLDYDSASGSVYFGLAVCEYYLSNYHSSMRLFEKAQEMGEYVPEKYFEFVREKIEKQK